MEPSSASKTAAGSFCWLELATTNSRMSSSAQEALREALAWSKDERAELAAELLTSLDDADPEVADLEAEWAAEIEKRAHRVLSCKRASETADF